MLRRFFVISAALLAGGCEQDVQKLPFEVDAVITRTVGAGAGGVVSAPGGASVSFPTGSVTGTAQVTLAPAALPGSIATSGAPASEGFAVGPVGTVLSRPASLEMKFTRLVDRAWLASVVGVSNGVVREYGATRVDLTTGIAATEIANLGSFAVVIPDPAAVHRVQATPFRSEILLPSTVLPGQTTRSVTVDCGAPGNRCTGLTATASQNLLDQIADAAAIYPAVSGRIDITGARATGLITMTAPVRVLLQSGSTAEVINFVATIAPTASTVVTETPSEIRMTNVRQRVTGGAGSESGTKEVISTLVIARSSGNGSIVVQRQFSIRVSGGSTQTASIAVTMPVQLNP